MGSQEPRQSPFAWIGLTLLAWLGLAGLADEFIEWQAWFEHGLMQHWRSVKEWSIAVLLDWVPFRVPGWFLDYALLGFIVMKSVLPFTELNAFVMTARRGEGVIVDDRGNPIDGFWGRLSVLGSFWFVCILVALLWPISIWQVILGKGAAEERKKLILNFVGFIPVLFVVSTLLYKFG